MEVLKEKLEQIKSLLEEFKVQLNPFLNNASLNEKQTQLNEITKLTEKFDKLGTAIPNEIRSLKFKLISELDQYTEIETLKQEFNNILSNYLIDGKVKKYKKSSYSSTKKVRKVASNKRSNVQLIDLIDKGIIQPNTYITRDFKGTTLKGKINANGQIEVEHNGDLLTFNSLSTAAAKLTNRSISGWDWWRIEGDPKKRTINYYRQKLIRNGE